MSASSEVNGAMLPPSPRLPYVSPTARIFEREALLAEVAALRERGARVVLARGGFERLDLAAIRMLQAARRLGDVLVVAVSPEGEHPAADRMFAVAALECVTAVALDDGGSAEPGLTAALRPDRIAEDREAIAD